MIKKLEDIEVYKLSHDWAMKIFNVSKIWPVEERYSLTDQIRRSSRSVAVNIAEGWGKRIYPQNVKRHLVDSLGSLEESKSWLKFGKDCGYIDSENYKVLLNESEQIGAMIWTLHKNWKT